MTTARLAWTEASALAHGARVVGVILVAGLPHVFTPAGVRPTTVAVTSGTVHPLFWPGTGDLEETLPDASTFDPVEDLLDVDEEWQFHERVSALDGDVTVESFAFSVLDADGRATALLSRREAMTTAQLTADLTASSVAIPVTTTASFPSSGIAALGRETVTYSSTSGVSINGVTRGKYGSRARIHTAPLSHRPVVAAGGGRHWQGRVATVWICALSADGTTLTDPTLLYIGQVGAGIQLTERLTRWSVPLDHATEAMGRKLSLATVDLYGWAHFAVDDAHPLLITDNGLSLALDGNAASPHNEGWHLTREDFVTAADAYARAESTGTCWVRFGANNRMGVTVAASGGSPHNTYVTFGWDDARWDDQINEDPATLFSIHPAPSDCFRLEGPVMIPAALDFARIPTTFRWTVTTSTGRSGEAVLALTADTKHTRGLVAEIRERSTTRQTVTVEAALPMRASLTAAEIARATLCVERTTAQLGLVARGDTPASALQAASLALDAISGQDLFSSAIDWPGVEAALATAPARIDQRREYRFGGGDDTFLSVLIDEARLHGLVLAIANGLITMVRLAVFADTEQTVDSITEADILCDAQGNELDVLVEDNNEPLATSMRFVLPTSDPDKTRSITVTDTTWQGEMGDGATVECRALLSLPRDAVPADIQSALVDVAVQVLGPLAEPNRTITIPVSPTKLGLQPGQLVAFTHSRIPTWDATRGFVASVCQVQAVRRTLFGGRLRGTIVLRLQSGTRVGYAPAALVAAGGLSAASPVVTLDITSDWGPACFAPATDAFGVATTDPAYGLEVGHVVRLSQFARAPIASEVFTIVSINIAAHTVTLSGNPSASMAAAAAGAYGVSLRFASYGAATANQQSRWAWVADATTLLLDGTDAPKRWAA